MASRKRKAYSINDKIQIVDRLRSGESQASVSRELGISDSTLRGWLKADSKLRASLGDMNAGGSMRKRQRTAKDQQLEKAVIDWFNHERSQGTPISGPRLQDQAKVFHSMIHGEHAAPFEGSKGWLRNFKCRHDLTETRVRGNIFTADVEERLNVDRDLSTNTLLTDAEIVANACSSEVTSVQDHDDDDVDMEPLPAMSVVVAGLQTGLRWLESSESATKTQVLHLRDIIALAKAASRESCKQRKLTEFFKRTVTGV